MPHFVLLALAYGVPFSFIGVERVTLCCSAYTKFPISAFLLWLFAYFSVLMAWLYECRDRSDLESVMITVFGSVFSPKRVQTGGSPKQQDLRIFLDSANFSENAQGHGDQSMSLEDLRRWFAVVPSVRKFLGSLLVPPNSGFLSPGLNCVKTSWLNCDAFPLMQLAVYACICTVFFFFLGSIVLILFERVDSWYVFLTKVDSLWRLNRSKRMSCIMLADQSC